MQVNVIETVDQFVYLGQLVSYPRNHNREISRRIRSGWNAFHKYRYLLTAKNIAMKLKRRLFNCCIVPTRLYGSESWALTKATENRLATAQRRMERYAIGIRLLDRKTNEWIKRCDEVQRYSGSSKKTQMAMGKEGRKYANGSMGSVD